MIDNAIKIIRAQLFTSISQIDGVGPKRADLYKNLGVTSIRDLLLLMPNKIIKKKLNPLMSDITIGDQIIKNIKVKSLNLALKFGNSRRPSKVICESNNEMVELIYFNSRIKALTNLFAEASELIVSGQVTNIVGNIIEIVHPYQVVKSIDSFKISEFEPIYPATMGLNSRFINITIKKVLAKLVDIPEWLPIQLLNERKWPSFKRALNIIHNPKKLADVEMLPLAKQRLAFDEILCRQIKLQEIKESLKKSTRPPIRFKGLLKDQMLKLLSFKLTSSQYNTIEEIERDLNGDIRICRLIQGDVGSGKTLVALALILDVIEAGFQAALMVPTEILANQHFKTISTLVEKLGVKAQLLIGALPNVSKTKIQTSIASGETQIIIGTHALFQEKVTYKNLRLAVVDEQHRFGVDQRRRLMAKNDNVDFIMMTATPIPRTLEIVNYGDMDISVIREKPAHRLDIITKVMSSKKIEELEDSFKEKIQMGEKIYWVCPLIEETEKLDVAHAQARYESLSFKYEGQVGLIHGRMKATLRDEAMQKFINGQYKIIVATTVIEVGVDVKDATIIVIENSERFGLSQLHQLRGRVGRGDKQSYCILIYGNKISKVGQARLNIMKQSNDGFYIAEEDLKIRGFGDIAGTQQSGMFEFRVFNLETDTQLLNTAYNLAQSNSINSKLLQSIYADEFFNA